MGRRGGLTVGGDAQGGEEDERDGDGEDGGLLHFDRMIRN
jgi:hypothetical protein